MGAFASKIRGARQTVPNLHEPYLEASSTPKKKISRASGGKWVASEKTVSTFPPSGLFTKKASAIARSLASKNVSPKGPTSGLRMLTYFINCGGKGLGLERRAELEKARALLSARIHRGR